MRFFLSLLISLFLGTSAAQAQIIAVHLKDAKAAKKYKAYLVEYHGEMVVIGESKSGFVYNESERSLRYKGDDANELFVLDPKKPEAYAYFLVDGVKVEASKKNRVTIQGGQIDRISMVMRDQTLPGLTTEYLLKKREIEEFKQQRNSYEEGTAPWLAAHHRLVTDMERFETWLASVGFSGPIKKLQKAIKKEKKEVRDAALAARADRAQESVGACEVPEELLAISDENYEGRHVFHALKSEHFRMYYLTEGNGGDAMHVDDKTATRLLKLAERILDGFRAEFVDPFIGDDFEDTLPEDLMAVWFFAPKSKKAYLSYMGAMYSYHQDATAGHEDVKGSTLFGGFPAHHRFTWRLDDLDLRGIICHNMGHALATDHFGDGHGQLHQDWLEEAVGNQISYQYLGRNNVNCLGMKEKPTYLKREITKPGEKTIAVGRRAAYNELALTQSRPMQQLAMMRLVELNDADIAKSWSFYDYISRKEGKAGQLWLRAAAKHASNPNTFIAKWRAAAAEILGVDEAKAFTEIEGRWRKFAENGQLDEDD